ncbi:sulfotransferase 6B1-like isoform X2 [Sceloporus undulatus]|uniref:sulfotransferase 6B1-like isoform X2 n=1 Tax=Sceloporus undulatus TaxID=8520 RepID=UPI001C4BDBE8|nr:sulfotransferase 6B1-like isoform X2 [Sceloporus undulatus]
MSTQRKKFIALVDKAMDDGAKMAPEDLMFSYKGILYPSTVCSPETFKALESFEARDDDVFLAGYPKSGTNWVGQILTDLVTTSSKHTENFNRVDDEELEEFPYLEVGDAEKYQILLLIRNPKDVATSFYHFSNGLSPLPTYKTFDDFFTAFMNGEMPWGSYFDYVFEWNKHADKKNVMTVTYEELKENRALGVKKISEFFEFPLTDEELQEVVDRSSFQAMKENSTKTHGAMGSVLFRKGSVNDWKNFFSEDHNQKMDMTFEERLGGTKLGEKLNYGVYCKA